MARSVIWCLCSILFLISCTKHQPGTAPNAYAASIIERIKENEYKDYEKTKSLAAQLLLEQSDENGKLIGEYYSRKADFLKYQMKALAPLQEWYDLLKAKGFTDYVFEIDFLLLNFYFSRQDVDNASVIMTRCLEYALTDKFELERNAILLGPASVGNRTDIALIEEEIIQLIDSNKGSEWSIYLNHLYLGLASVYTQKKDFQRAEEVVLQLIDQNRQNNYILPESNAYFVLSKIYLKQNKYEQAMAALEESVALSEGYGSYTHDSQENMLGHLHFNARDFEKAFTHYENAVTLALHQKDSTALAEYYAYLGWACFKADKDNNFEKANTYWEKSNDYSNKEGIGYLLMLQRKKWVLSGLGRQEEAAAVNQQLAVFRNETKIGELNIYNNYLLQNLAQAKILDLSVKNLKKDNQLKTEQLKNQQFIIFVGVILLVFVLLLASMVYKIRSKNQQLESTEKELLKSLDQLSEQNELIREQNDRLKFLVAQVNASNRDLQNFAEMAAHDIKAPLRTIIGFSQLLSRRHRNSLPKADMEMLDFIIGGGTDLSNIIDGLLEFSKVTQESNLSFERIDLNCLIEKCLKLIQAKADEKAAIISVADNIPEAFGVKVLLQQLFINLLSNSLKFARQNIAPEIQISYQLMEDGKFVKIAVQDNGIGIDKVYHEEIFDLFNRLHNTSEFEGHGMGLAICKKIIEKHKGAMWVASEVGKGATFFFTLPVENFNEPN